MTLQDSDEFHVQGGSNIFASIHEGANDEVTIKKTSTAHMLAKEQSEEAQIAIRGAMALPIDESASFIKIGSYENEYLHSMMQGARKK